MKAKTKVKTSFFAIDLRHAPKPTETNMDWLPSPFGAWIDFGNKFTGYLPDVDDSVFHFGPARIWARPVQRSRYGKSDT